MDETLKNLINDVVTQTKIAADANNIMYKVLNDLDVAVYIARDHANAATESTKAVKFAVRDLANYIKSMEKTND